MFKIYHRSKRHHLRNYLGHKVLILTNNLAKNKWVVSRINGAVLFEIKLETQTKNSTYLIIKNNEIILESKFKFDFDRQTIIKDIVKSVIPDSNVKIFLEI